MAETVIENRICKACNSEVRSNALFCYHCGSSVAPDIVSRLKNKSDGSERNGNNSGKLKQTIVEDLTDKPIPKPGLPEETNLKSAAAMRRKSKSFQPKQIEVVWEEYENAPNGWFILASILITLLAAGALYLAIQLK